MPKRFIPNLAGIAALAKTEDMVDGLKDIAEKGVEIADELAPVDEGDYREGLEAVAGIEGGKAVARINANDFKSWWVEHGTVDTPAYRVLGRTLDRLRS